MKIENRMTKWIELGFCRDRGFICEHVVICERYCRFQDAVYCIVSKEKVVADAADYKD